MGTNRQQYRNFLKDTVRRTIDFSMTDQSAGIAPPPLEKPFPADARRIDLVTKDSWRGFSGLDLISAIEGRRSHRRFMQEPLTMDDSRSFSGQPRAYDRSRALPRPSGPFLPPAAAMPWKPISVC
jgi:hypothetical protein